MWPCVTSSLIGQSEIEEQESRRHRFHQDVLNFYVGLGCRQTGMLANCNVLVLVL